MDRDSVILEEMMMQQILQSRKDSTDKDSSRSRWSLESQLGSAIYISDFSFFSS